MYNLFIMYLIPKNSEEWKEALIFINECKDIALSATCKRSKCGSLVVKNGEIIGRGFNSPANNLESQRRCTVDKDSYDKKVTNKTCCIHAEQRAIMDALKNNPDKISGSRIYFIRLDKNNGGLSFAGKPYCTICSSMTLESGISEFVLYQEDGIEVYGAEEYNTLSYQYKS